jgi:hypothetical protein
MDCLFLDLLLLEFEFYSFGKVFRLLLLPLDLNDLFDPVSLVFYPKTFAYFELVWDVVLNYGLNQS